VLATIKLKLYNMSEWSTNSATDSMYNLAMDLSTRVGKLLGTIGAQVKYDNPGMDNFTFRQLAKTYIECSTNEQDIVDTMEQANKRGVDLT
jgi:hypothetical protein